MPEFLTTPQGRRLALERSPGQGPEICFLHGLRSDMQGTKALHLEAWARAQGRAFLRFDCSGHGASGGAFEDGCISDWRQDAEAAIFATPGRKVLVGSSMGGWLALLIARARPEDLAGLVLVAPAPDFTSAIPPWPPARPGEAAALARDGFIARPSDYGPPLVFTRRLIEDGASQQVLGRPLALPMPTRILHGSADADVPLAVSRALFDQAQGPDLALTEVKGADHRFSKPAQLDRIAAAVGEVLAAQ